MLEVRSPHALLACATGPITDRLQKAKLNVQWISGRKKLKKQKQKQTDVRLKLGLHWESLSLSLPRIHSTLRS